MVLCDRCKKVIVPDMEKVYPFHMLKRIHAETRRGNYPQDVCPECFEEWKREQAK